VDVREMMDETRAALMDDSDLEVLRVLAEL
jgi:hypothetical protein